MMIPKVDVSMLDPTDGNDNDGEAENQRRQQAAKANVADFELLVMLGQGAFGKVFLVRKLGGRDSEKLYAMKVLTKSRLRLSERKRSKLERNVLVHLTIKDHPFIVILHYAFQTPEKLYLVMDFLRGGDMNTHLARQPRYRLSEEHARFYLAELVLALDYLHRRGIVYRDLKSENVLLDSEGHIKVVDFGLCKDSVEEGQMTYSLCGTPAYMAPEVVLRYGHSTTADWWSFGVLMYEMLVGKLPFDGHTVQIVEYQVLYKRMIMPDFLSEEAQFVLYGCFQRNPQERLGYGPDGPSYVMGEPFFKSINWDNLFDREIPPPFVPSVSADQTEHFDEHFTSTVPFLSPGVPLSPDADAIFEGFSFVAPHMYGLDGEEAEAAPDQPVTPKMFSPGRALSVQFEAIKSPGNAARFAESRNASSAPVLRPVNNSELAQRRRRNGNQ